MILERARLLIQCHPSLTEPGKELRGYNEHGTIGTKFIRDGDTVYSRRTKELEHKMEEWLLIRVFRLKTILPDCAHVTLLMYRSRPYCLYDQEYHLSKLMETEDATFIEHYFNYRVYATKEELQLYFDNFEKVLKRLAKEQPHPSEPSTPQRICRRFERRLLHHCRSVFPYAMDDFLKQPKKSEQLFTRLTFAVEDKVRFFFWELAKRRLRTMLLLASNKLLRGDGLAPSMSRFRALPGELVAKICGVDNP
jgi:hypothetical protein